MSDGVRETKCTNCEHKNVCMYKTKYLELIGSLSSVYSESIEGEIIFRFVDPDCVHYRPTISIIR